MLTPEILVILDDAEFDRMERREARRKSLALKRKVKKTYAAWVASTEFFWNELA